MFQGVWDAATNNPALTSSVGTKGYYYVVNVAGSTNLNGITDWKVGDWAIFDGTAWQKVDNTDSVSSVFGRVGAVVAASGDYTTTQVTEGTNLYYTEARVDANSNVAANTAARHNAVTLGTANGLSLSTQQLSLGLSSASANGALSSTDWSTFSGKQNALGGTGIVKSTGGTISYLTDNSTNWNTAYNDSIVSAGVTGTSTKTLTLNQQDGGTVTASWSDADTGLTSVGLTMPSAFSVANSPLTANGTLAVTGAGVASQYVRGDGTLAAFPTTSGGGSSVSYYFNGGTNQGTIGGNTYYEMSKTAVLGTGADFNINANGYIAQFVTDANDPSLLSIPAGNWNFEMWFSASSGGGSPSFYLELYKYDGATLTLISSGSAVPEYITGGTAIDLYTTALAVPLTTLTLTDRLAVRVYVNNSSRTITLHTQNSHLCQAITTFSTGLTALNGLTAQVQNLAVGTSGTDFGISSATSTHTFNLPTASAANRGALSSADWTTFNNKTSNLGTVTSVGLTSATSGVTIGASPVTTSGDITLAIATATSGQNGLLSSTDWTTFNNKASTAALANYLPLAGGTLTGALNGTSASFSGNATATRFLTNYSYFGGGNNYNIKLNNDLSADSGFIYQLGGSTAIASNSYYNSAGVYTATATTASSIELAGGATVFYNNSGLTSGGTFGQTERMRITSAGNVGIGTTSPSDILHIEKNGTLTYTSLKVTNTNSTAVFYVGIGGNSVANGGLQNNAYLFNDGNSAMVFGTNATERMRITSSGNVLIGTTTDAGYKLDVNGTARVSSNAILNNVGWGGVTPVGDGGNCSTIEGANGAQIAARNGFAQLYIGSNVVGTPYSATRSVAGYATQLSLDALGGTISLNRAVSGAAGSAISWINVLGFDNTGAATFGSSVTAGQGKFYSGSSSIDGLIVGGAGGIGTTSQGVLRFGDAGNIYKIQGGQDYGAINFLTNNITRFSIADTGEATFSSTLKNSQYHYITNTFDGRGLYADDGYGAAIFSLTREAGNEVRLQSVGYLTFLTNGANERMRIKSSGVINISNIPTSSAGLSAGDIWSDSGTLKIV